MCGGWLGENVLEPAGLGKGLSDVPGFSQIGDVLASPLFQQVAPALAGFALGGPVGGAFGMGALGGGALVGAGTGALLNYKNRGQGALLGGLGGGAGGAMGGAEGGFASLLGGGEAAAAPTLAPEVGSGLALGGDTLATGGAMGLEGTAPTFAEPMAAMGGGYPSIPVTGSITDTLMKAKAAGTPGIMGGAGSTTGGGMFEQLMSALGMGGGAGAGGGMGIGNMLGLSGLVNSGIGLYQSNQLMNAARGADPWSAYRGDAAGRLNALMQDPSSITGLPGYQAGLQAVQRSMGAQGYQGSGNMMNALSQYGGQFYNDALKNLSSLSGTGNTGISLQGQSGAANMMGQSLAGIPNSLLYMMMLGGR